MAQNSALAELMSHASAASYHTVLAPVTAANWA